MQDLLLECLLIFLLLLRDINSFPKYLKNWSVTVIMIKVESAKVQNRVRQDLGYKDIFILSEETGTIVKIQGSALWKRKEVTET